jgi:hypothetical protein
MVNGQIIGLINNWAPTESRTITPIYEINPESSGLPYENVPGNTTGLQISISRYDLWTIRMEQAFGVPVGNSNIRMLNDQKAPFTVNEKWVYPDGSVETWAYVGCWFSQLGRAMRSDDQRTVMVNATLTYLRKERT